MDARSAQRMNLLHVTVRVSGCDGAFHFVHIKSDGYSSWDVGARV